MERWGEILPRSCSCTAPAWPCRETAVEPMFAFTFASEKVSSCYCMQHILNTLKNSFGEQDIHDSNVELELHDVQISQKHPGRSVGFTHPVPLWISISFNYTIQPSGAASQWERVHWENEHLSPNAWMWLHTAQRRQPNVVARHYAVFPQKRHQGNLFSRTAKFKTMAHNGLN